LLARLRSQNPIYRRGQVAHRARDHAHHVPQQSVVRGMMNIGLNHRCVDRSLRATLRRMQEIQRMATAGPAEGGVPFAYRCRGSRGERRERPAYGKDMLADLAVAEMLAKLA
jgi:hypothetical protein